MEPHPCAVGLLPPERPGPRQPAHAPRPRLRVLRRRPGLTTGPAVCSGALTVSAPREQRRTGSSWTGRSPGRPGRTRP
ncbi:MAG: hypothetical protein DI618_01900 [Dermacoccus nishinomiyaensis]|nr:MAG: hypothetical protein DI618_01900 [Dermacoccus nishinomiyaensis]